MLNALRSLVAPRRRASAVTRLEVEATRGADATWTDSRSFEALATEGYEHAVWAYACVRVLTTQLKNFKPILYRGTGPKRAEVEAHPLLDLLNAPNDEMSRAELLEAAYGFYLVGGNTYIEQVAAGENSPPVELWVKRPDRIRVIPDPQERIRGYRYEVNGATHAFERWQIAHLKTWAPLDEWYGLSPLAAAARGVDLFNAGQAHNLALLQNGARPSGAWISSGPLEPRTRDRIRDELREAAQIGRRGRTLVLEGGISWQELGVKPKDLDWLNGQTDAARQIHAAYGVHPVLTGLETGTYENQKQAMRSALLMTVFPFAEQLVDRLNRWLVPKYGPDLTLDFDRDAFPAVSEDQDSIWERATTGWSKGILTRNESRALIGYDAVDEEERGEIFVTELYGRVPLTTTLPPAAAAAARALPAPDRTRYRRAFHLADDADRALYWRARVDLQERWEQRAAETTRAIFEDERATLARRFEAATTPADLMVITATVLADTTRWDALTPVLLGATIAGGESVLDRLETDEARARRTRNTIDPAAYQVFGLVAQETIDVALAHMPKLVGQISETTLEAVAHRIANGASDGLSMPNIAATIDELYLEQIIPNRSLVIARTETIRSTNYGGQQAARGTGLDLTKTWLTSIDGREREAHNTANGQTVPMDAHYNVDGEALAYPGDPSGSAGNVIQCRCSEYYTEVSP